jgi:hypothetical protein
MPEPSASLGADSLVTQLPSTTNYADAMLVGAEPRQAQVRGFTHLVLMLLFRQLNGLLEDATLVFEFYRLLPIVEVACNIDLTGRVFPG